MWIFLVLKMSKPQGKTDSTTYTSKLKISDDEIWAVTV